MAKEITKTEDYRKLIIDLKSRVQAAQIKAAVSVNTLLIALYWDIGKTITERQATSGWGNNVIGQIAKDLTRELGGAKGFSRSNLYYMKQWYSFYTGHDENVQQAVGRIPWGHNVLIIQKIKNIEKAFWYIQQTIDNNWSRDVLGFQIENQLYERQAAKKKIDNFSDRLPSPQSELARDTIKDPYIFDFLDVDGEAHERKIEQALVDRVTEFLLEMGKGFAFVGKQYHLEVGGDDFYIDLLCYHLRLHCYVVIELKNGPFKPEYAGKLNFYLTAIDRQVKTDIDNPSIGLILCRDRNQIVAEYALQDMNKPMGVARYETRTIPDELKNSLPSIEALEKELSEDEEKL